MASGTWVTILGTLWVLFGTEVSILNARLAWGVENMVTHSWRHAWAVERQSIYYLIVNYCWALHQDVRNVSCFSMTHSRCQEILIIKYFVWLFSTCTKSHQRKVSVPTFFFFDVVLCVRNTPISCNDVWTKNECGWTWILLQMGESIYNTSVRLIYYVHSNLPNNNPKAKDYAK